MSQRVECQVLTNDITVHQQNGQHMRRLLTLPLTPCSKSER